MFFYLLFTIGDRLFLRFNNGELIDIDLIDLNLFNAYINKTADLEEILNAPPPHGPMMQEI